MKLLFVVGREESKLYASLCREFAGDKGVAVVLDRRFGERRIRREPTVEERRRSDRRQRPEADERLADFGWALVRYPAAG